METRGFSVNLQKVRSTFLPLGGRARKGFGLGEASSCNAPCGHGSKPMGSHFGISVPPIFRTYFSGDWLGCLLGVRGFDPWPSVLRRSLGNAPSLDCRGLEPLVSEKRHAVNGFQKVPRVCKAAFCLWPNRNVSHLRFFFH